jgi:hypothetical protein
MLSAKMAIYCATTLVDLRRYIRQLGRSDQRCAGQGSAQRRAPPIRQ